MIVDIKISETVGGDLLVQELSYEEGAYADTVEEQFKEDSVMFTESSSITVLKKHTLSSVDIQKCYIHNHENTNVSNTFRIESDGWYEVNHLIVPTSEWLEQATEYFSNYNHVYIAKDNVLYEHINDELVEVDVEEVIANIDNSNAWMTDVNTFVIFDLWQCYLNYCKKMLEDECSKDSQCFDCDSESAKNRNLLWIFLNAIQYMVGFGEFDKAQEFLENLSGCNSLCKNEMFSKQYDCGC